MIRIYRKSNPRFQPHLYSGGTYRVHRRNAGSARNLMEYSQSVATIEELAALVESKKWVVRMSEEGRGISPVLIGPLSIVIEAPDRDHELSRHARQEAS